MRLSIAAAMAVFLCAPAYSETLDDILGWEAPQCVPFEKVKSVSKHIVDLNEAQFQFLRGLYMGLPPATISLIPGDKAAVADDGDMLTIFFIDSDSDQVCVRFAPRPFADYAPLLNVINDVGAGKKPKAKDVIGKGL